MRCPSRLRILLALLLLATGLPSQAAVKDVLPGYLGSIVLVDTATSTGTAFAVEGASGVTRFLTNSHVVEGAGKVELVLPSGTRYEARVVADDPTADLALLEAPGVSVPVLPLWEAGDGPPLGSDLAVVGYPLPDKLQSVGLELQPSVSKGILSAVRKSSAGVLYQVDVSINPGNSGGPGLDWETGAVVGVASSGLSGAQGINFLVGLPTIRSFLATRPRPALKPLAQTSSLSIPEALRQLGLKFEVDGDGDYELLFNLEGGRTQLVFIRGRKETYRSLQVVEIFSPAFNLQDALTAELATKLMLDSQNAKVGGWQLRLGKQVEYAVKVSDQLTPQQLRDLVEYVMEMADRMEHEITGRDDF